jgi:phage terminase small subunit
MRTGRKPIATELHKLRGTFRPTRHRDRDGEPVPSGKLGVDAPHRMTPLQAEYWGAAVEAAPPDLLRSIDGAALSIYAVAAALHQQACEEQAKEALSPDGKTMSPYLKIADIAGSRMLRAIGELGFSPSSRPRLPSSGVKAKGEDPAADFWSRFGPVPANAS